MIPVLTKEQAYKLDKDTIDSGHLSKEQLMDNAGKAIAQFFCEKINNPFSQKVVVVCGKGNNGGDGVIAHSYLKYYGVSSKIIFTEQNSVHSKLFTKYKISESEYYILNNKTNFDEYDWIIDGVFGIGLTGNIEGKYKKLLIEINKRDNVIGIDITSGAIDFNDEIKTSKHTITFGFPKLGHYLNSTNNIHIVDIGFCKLKKTKINKIEYLDILSIIKNTKTKKNINKFDKGLAQIIAGSNKYSGAAILASKAAKKTGAGYVKLFIDSSGSIIDKINSQNLEILIEEYDEDLNQLPLSLNRSVLIGPGIEIERVERILLNFSTDRMYDDAGVFHDGAFDEEYDNWGDFVFDAGAISALRSLSIKKNINLLDILPPRFILTPHSGEIASMFPPEGDETAYDFSYIEKIQKELINVDYDCYKQIIIYKSWNTFIITKDMIYIMDKGPSLLATAGTGDVLSGILVSLLSQGYSRLEASILGTYLHAEAANYYMNNISKDGMTASDLIDCIPMAFNILRNND